MAPTSYQSAPRADAGKDRTFSQSIATNTPSDSATVGKLVSSKGGNRVFAIRPDDTLSDAVKMLRDKRVGALVVTEADGSLAGILSERDIVRKLAETPGQTLPQTVRENMTPNVITCEASDPLVKVLRLMIDGKFRHMPVMENGKPSGMVTIGDVVHFRLNELEHEALQLKQMIVG